MPAPVSIATSSGSSAPPFWLLQLSGSMILLQLLVMVITVVTSMDVIQLARESELVPSDRLTSPTTKGCEPVDLTSSFSKKIKGCLDLEGNKYKVKGVVEACCYKYTCSKAGKKAFKWKKTVDASQCCAHEGSFFQIGETISTENIENSCTSVQQKCVQDTNGKPTVEKHFHHNFCCSYEDTVIPVGSSIPMPENCASLQCNQGTWGPTYSIERSFASCGCCWYSGMMVEDGSSVMADGVEAKCCNGTIMAPVDLSPPTMGPTVILVTGGRDENNNDLASSEIITSEGVCPTSIPPLPVTLTRASSVYFDGSLMVCGGYYRNNGFQNKCYLLDSSTSTWRTGPQMNTARYLFTLIKVGGAVYAVGGFNGGRLDSMEKLEGTSWTFLPQKMSSGTYTHCTVNIGNQLVVIGGLTPTGHTDKVESFDVLSSQWTPLPPLPLKLQAHKCTTFKEAIYVSGGSLPFVSGGSPLSNKVFMYQDGSWSTAGELEVARAHHTMGVVDGKLLVAGGYIGDTLDSLETMDDHGQWKKLQWTVSKRSYSAMAQVPRDKFPCNP